MGADRCADKVPLMITWLWGVKSVALLDVWSVEHVLSGLSIGLMVKKKNGLEIGLLLKRPHHTKCSVHFDLVGVSCAAYAWETFEHYLETGLAGLRVEHWFMGVEMWGNRLIMDPLMLVLGYCIVTRYPRLVWPARIASAAWLTVHVLVFPNSMYLQKFL